MPSDLIFTIHGTKFVGKTSVEDPPQWWQENSEFVRGLKTCWPADRNCKIEPLEWSGENKKDERDKCARHLRDRLHEVRNHYDRIYVIGHSHAGNVISSAIKTGIRRGLTRKFTFLTVGSPFFDDPYLISDSIRNLKHRFPIIVFGFCLIFATLLLLQDTIANYLDSLPSAVSSLLTEWSGCDLPSGLKRCVSQHPIRSSLIYSFACLVAFLVFTKFLMKLFSYRFLSPSGIAAKTFIVIYDRDDEAIEFLKQARALLDRYISEDSLTEVIYRLVLSAAVLGGLWILITYVGNNVAVYNRPWCPLLVSLSRFDFTGYLSGINCSQLTFKSDQIIVLLGLFVGLASLLILVLYFLNWIYDYTIRKLLWTFSMPLAQLAKRHIARLIIRNVSGGSIYTKTQENWREPSWNALDDKTHDLLARKRHENTKMDVPDWIRSSTHSDPLTARQGLEQILTNLGGIHTSYFDIPVIRRLIYYALQVRSGIGVSERLTQDKRVAEIYRHICPESQGHIQ